MSYNESLSSRSNYPPMSQLEWDNAPFNQPMDDDFTRTVSVSMSFDYTVRLTVDYTEEEIKEYIENEVREILNEKLSKDTNINDFGIDEIEVLDE